MTVLIGYRTPEGDGGYLNVSGVDRLDCIRNFRIMFGYAWTIEQFIEGLG